MIKASTLNFLERLAENNNRDWFQANKQDYDAARENVLEFTSGLINALAGKDPTVPAEVQAKDCLMRIYRDVRFSKNKAPYKNNFGIAISGTGKNFNGPGYYVHIQPGKSFIAAGSWMPEPDQLKAIRQEIDYNGADLLDVVNNADFKKLFGDLSTEDQLKTVPKGYTADHPMINYLKLKSFNAVKSLTDKELTASGAGKKIVDMFGTLYPMMVFLRNAIV